MHTRAHKRRECARACFVAKKRTRAYFSFVCAHVFTDLYEFFLIILYYLMNISFRCGDICKSILTFKNHQFSMYFAYFHSFAPSKSSKMDNYWIIIKFFGNKISKCTYLMNKKTPVPAYRLLCSPVDKQIVFDSL